MSSRAPFGFVTALALGVNTIVGSGIFRLPAELAKTHGARAPWIILLGALALAPVALSYAYASSLFDHRGGPYLYSRDAFGPRVGFAVGWSTWIATVLTLATVAVAIPAQVTAAPWVAAVAPPALILTLGALHLIGMRPTGALNVLFAIAKVIPLVLFVGAPLFIWTGTRPAQAATGHVPVGPGLLTVFFALSGFETPTIPAGDVENAKARVPWAVLGSLLGAAVLYAFIQSACAALVPDLSASERPLVDGMRILFGDGAARATGFFAAGSILGLMLAMTVAGPQLLASFAEDGHLPVAFARGPTPRLGIFVSSIAAAVLSTTLNFATLVDFTSVILVAQYAATCASVLVFRGRRRRWGAMLVPVLGLGFLAYVAAQAKRNELLLALATVVIGEVLAGLHHLWQRRVKP